MIKKIFQKSSYVADGAMSLLDGLSSIFGGLFNSRDYIVPTREQTEKHMQDMKRRTYVWPMGSKNIWHYEPAKRDNSK